MKLISHSVFLLVILVGSLFGDQFQALLPQGVKVTADKVTFSRNFLQHQLHAILCREAKKAREEGGETLAYWTNRIHSLDGISYAVRDDVDEADMNGKLNLKREKLLLEGIEEPLAFSVLRLNYPVDGLKGKVDDIVDLSQAAFGDGDFFSLDVRFTAWLQSPVIHLLYEKNSKQLIGQFWAVPYPKTKIRQEDGSEQVVTVHYIHSFCTHPEYTGRGIGRQLLKSLRQDPLIQYAVFEVAPDNLGAQKLYATAGYHLAEAPPIKMGMNKTNFWLYGAIQKDKIAPFLILKNK